MSIRKRKPMDGLDALKSALGSSRRDKPPQEETGRGPEPEPADDETFVDDTPAPAMHAQAQGPEPGPAKADPERRPEPSQAKSGSDRRPDPGPQWKPVQPAHPAQENTRRPTEGSQSADRSKDMAETPKMTSDSKPSGELGSIQTGLEGIFKQQAEAAASASGRVVGNLKESGEILDRQYRRIIEMLRAVELLMRDAGKVGESVKKRRELKASIEEAIGELTVATEQLDKNHQRLGAEKEGLLSEKDNATGENDELNATIRELTEDISSFQKESEDLTLETAGLEKERDRLEEDVRRLTRLKEEYLANVARFREGEGG